MRRVWLWWSTGKDSAWALHLLRRDPGVRVERLVTTVTPHFGRVAVHGTRTRVLEAQARAAGLPLERAELPWPCPNEAYEEAVAGVVRKAREAGVGHMAFGDLFLADIRGYREGLLEGTGVEPIFPVWGLETGALARRMMEEGVEARVTTLDPERVDRGLAGAPWDARFLESLPAGVDPCGENGEFHTCVVAGPMLQGRVEVRVGEVVERDGFVYADLLGGDATPEL